MKRYVKVKGKWIDTLTEQKDYGRYYFIINNRVSYYSDEYGVEYEIGRLQDETDTLEDK